MYPAGVKVGYEAEFLGFSYGFRPGRSQHDALDALAYGIKTRKICWILDSDIQSFFDQLSREWLVRFVEYRIGDRRIIRLIQKWLTAGVLEEGRRIETTAGTPQGSVASPLLANAYLHYVYDLWVQQWRERHATGDMIVVRYCDDSIVGFQHRQDAERFLNDLRERLGKFALNLHPEKTRLIEFGRHAAEDRASRPRIASTKVLPVGVVASAEMLPAIAPATIAPPLPRRGYGCVIRAMSVHGFTACRSRISRHAGQGFRGMSVQRFTACRSSS